MLNKTGFYPNLNDFRGWQCASRDKKIAKQIRERGINLHDFVFFHEWGDSDLTSGSWGMVTKVIDTEKFEVYWWDNSYEYDHVPFGHIEDEKSIVSYQNLIPFDIMR